MGLQHYDIAFRKDLDLASQVGEFLFQEVKKGLDAIYAITNQRIMLFVAFANESGCGLKVFLVQACIVEGDDSLLVCFKFLDPAAHRCSAAENS